MVVEKSYNNVPNTIHQGALIEDVAGKWWTIMQEDLGAMGRMPNLQPVTWTNDGWLKVGNNGRPYESFVSKINKPAATGDVRVKHLPTTDVFRTYPIGMQWEWNHKPDNNAWSLMERPGWLRLKTSNVTTKLPQARNMLTQRIFAIPNQYTNGSVRLDVSQLNEGDRAGICILQDPYAMIGVEKKDGQAAAAVAAGQGARCRQQLQARREDPGHRTARQHHLPARQHEVWREQGQVLLLA